MEFYSWRTESLNCVAGFSGAIAASAVALAEYVGRIAVEIRRRPRFLVRETTRTAVAASDKRARRGAVVDFRAET